VCLDDDDDDDVRVADGGERLETSRLAANIWTKKSRTADKWWS
jgi:hypothetical protein